MSPRVPELRGRARAGFSLVEAALSMVLVAGLLVAALNVAGAAGVTRAAADRRAAAASLAESLLAETLTLAYDDPEGGPVRGPSNGWTGPAWGPDAGEGIRTNRIAYDDVDDLDGWSSTPPEDTAGLPLPGAAGFTRSAVVRHVARSDPGVEAAADEGLKRVVVTVSFGGRDLAEAVGLASRAGARP